MTMTDPIADMFARLRNGLKQQHPQVTLPSSKLKKAVLDVLKAEGYINNWSETDDAKGFKSITVDLKYFEGKPVISRINRVSKPGLRIYSASKELPKVANGLGVTIVSTSQGVMTDTKAREMNVGGEVIGQVL